MLSKLELNELLERSGFPCVSIFLPTHQVTAHSEQDRIRLKNLVRQAENRLLAGGLRTPEAGELLEPARQLLDDSFFWSHQSHGLAVFLASGFAQHYCLPLAFDELVVVSDRFHLKPLLPLLTEDGRFFILVISQDEAKLLEGTRHSVAEVDLEGVPQDLAEALKYDDLEKQLQFHTRAPGRGSQRAAMFHGHGQTHGADPKDRLLRYFQQIDQGVWEVLRNEHVPLVLAGVEYYLPIYRQANSYRHLVETVIAGSPNKLRPEELHQRAWAILEPHFREERENAQALYRQLVGTRRASADLKEILPAAHQGRVESLFVALGQQRWGTFEPDNGTITTHEEPQLGDRDLLDLAAAQAFSNGGAVYAVNPAEMPDGGGVAAVFRY